MAEEVTVSFFLFVWHFQNNRIRLQSVKLLHKTQPTHYVYI